MAWTSLSSRLSSLPLVLAGPILRRTEKNSVTVWVALKESKDVTLKVFSRGGSLILEGTGFTTSLSSKIHVVAVTADISVSGTELGSGSIYLYDLEFGSSSVNLSTSGVLSSGAGGIDKITYGSDPLPSFSLPAEDINDLKIMHGSCRKPHGENFDSMIAVSQAIGFAYSGDNEAYANNRPQQLFLTGDQIYSDDVADSLLYMIRDASDSLFQWKEKLTPTLSNSDSRLKPGKRSSLIRSNGFSKVDGEENYSKSHLMHFSDYVLMYIFCWSLELWPSSESSIPDYAIVGNDGDEDTFNKELKHLKLFYRSIDDVRRSLANIPTYMMFDDHEITDDWYISRNWSYNVLNHQLGIRIISNGLMAYSVFQGWGNEPSFYEGYEPGKELLDALDQNDATHNFDTIFSGSQTYWQKFRSLLGVPTQNSVNTNKRLIPVAGSIPYHFSLDCDYYQVIALDLRTMRWFNDSSGFAYPQLISEQGLFQLDQLDANKEFVLLISGTPIFGNPPIEKKQRQRSSELDRLEDDCEAWGLRKRGVEGLLSKLAQSSPKVGFGSFKGRIIVLSGDVHQAFVNRCEFWATEPYNAPSEWEWTNPHMVIAQLTASSMKNEEHGFATVGHVHEIGWDWYGDGLPESARIFGFNNSTGKWKIHVANQVGVLTTDELYANGGSSATINISDFDSFGGVSQDIQLVEAHDWQYRIDYFMDTRDEREVDGNTESAAGINIPPSGDRNAALDEYLKMARNHSDYNWLWGDGKEIVGLNNIAMVRFDWGANEDEKFVFQDIWWRLKKSDTKFLQPFPLTVIKVPMGLGLPNYPKPEDTI